MRPVVILPDSGNDLLRQELSLGFSSLGLEVRRVHPAHLGDPSKADYLPRLLELKPVLFFSVNLQGLLPGGSKPAMLLEAGVPVVAWLVDNPWNVLSGMRDPSWKNFTLALTDHSFMPALALNGAQKVLHMPLAACLVCMGENQRRDWAFPPPVPLKEVVFAGRLSFPEREVFFAGQNPPKEKLEQAMGLMRRGARPDFQWWVEVLAFTPGQAHFWPGKKARLPGAGAASSNMLWREMCLNALQDSLTLFGGDEWLNVLDSGVDLRGPVDYYARMPGIYRAASFALNLNSLLLPAGLSQRIFDVWIAGGFCLTDSNAGLRIFPPELTEAVSFRLPEELPELAQKLKENPRRKEELRAAWREEITARHTYTARLLRLMEELAGK